MRGQLHSDGKTPGKAAMGDGGGVHVSSVGHPFPNNVKLHQCTENIITSEFEIIMKYLVLIKRLACVHYPH